MSGRGRPGLSTLRICSVFEPPPDLGLAGATPFDPVGGMQNHAAALTRALDRMGIRQTIVTTRPPGALPRERIGRLANIIRLGWPIRRFRQLYAVPALAHVSRRSDPIDIVHVHVGEDLAVIPLGVAAMRSHAAPLIVTIHCSLTHTFLGSGPRGLVLHSVGGYLERFGVREAAEVIVLTDRTARTLRSCHPRRVSVIPSGIERQLFEGPWEDPLPGVPHPRVVYAGRLAEQKAVWRLVDALCLLPALVHLVLVGDGPQRGAIERHIRTRHLGGRVTITGFVHHREIPAYVANADVFVLPSLYEEFGSVLLEAMAAGVPVVASTAGGIRSVVRAGENGLVCDCGDATSLAAAIARVLGDDMLRDRLRRKGLMTVEEHDWDALARRVLAVYERSVGAKPGERTQTLTSA